MLCTDFDQPVGPPGCSDSTTFAFGFRCSRVSKERAVGRSVVALKPSRASASKMSVDCSSNHLFHSVKCPYLKAFSPWYVLNPRAVSAAQRLSVPVRPKPAPMTFIGSLRGGEPPSSWPRRRRRSSVMTSTHRTDGNRVSRRRRGARNRMMEGRPGASERGVER